MAQTNYTPISLYYSATASNVPTAANLVPGELAINTADGKLYYEDSAGVVQVLASKATSSGTFGALSATSITNSGLTTGRVVYTTTGGLETSSATLTYDGTTLTATTGANFGTTSGSVGIGTASPTKKLTVSTNTSTDGILITGSTNPRLQVIDTTNSVTLELISGDSQATIRTDTNHPLVFGANGTEWMTLSAVGNLLAGKTASGQVLSTGFEYNNTSNQQYLSICNNTAGNTALFVANNGTTGTRQLIQFYAGSSACGSITWNGTIIALNQPSDQRLKENIADSGSGLAKLNNIKIRAFDWKESGLHTDFGVIAQELETVAPEAVTQGEDNEDDSIKRYWGVNTSALLPAMIKAIQELKAEVDSLKQQLASK
jgi:hypothetical protein